MRLCLNTCYFFILQQSTNNINPNRFPYLSYWIMCLYLRLLQHRHVASTTAFLGVNTTNDNGRKGCMRLRDNVNLERNSTVEGVQAGEGYKEEKCSVIIL